MDPINSLQPELFADQNDLFFNISLDMLCIASLDGYFKKVNPAFEKILGYTQQELLARPFVSFVHPDDRLATIREMEKLSQGIDSIHFENRYLCKNGQYKWLAWTCPAPKSKEEFLYAIARDLTEFKRATEALKESEGKLREQTRNLERKNTALNEILAQID